MATETKSAIKNSINWFEIPVENIERACRFYETVLDLRLKRDPEFMGELFGIFPADEPGVAGALVQGPKRAPGNTGTIVYIDAPELEAALGRVPKAGGSISLPLTDIGPMGKMAVIVDTEGNRVGLHQAPQG